MVEPPLVILQDSLVNYINFFVAVVVIVFTSLRLTDQACILGLLHKVPLSNFPYFLAYPFVAACSRDILCNRWCFKYKAKLLNIIKGEGKGDRHI